ncbi:Coiled-coil and c2 domain-containing protein 2a, partial [Globisporangium splendens]
MRTAGDKTEESPEVDEDTSPRKTQRQGAGVTENNGNNSRVEEMASPTSRRRRRSDTELRDELEKQRQTNQNAKMRSLIATNRFLAKKKQEPKNAPQDPEDDTGANAMASSREDEDKTSDADAEAGANLKPHGLVVTKKKSTAAISSTQVDANNKQQNHAIVHPGVHLLPGTAIHPSTLVRLEERLRREQSEADAESKISTPFPLTDLIHGRKPHLTESPHHAHDGAFFGETTARRAVRTKSTPTQVSSDAFQSAVLEVYIDKIVLDDHVSFALVDQISAQLRSLYTTYGQMQQQQLWKLPLDRIEAFIDKYCEPTSRVDNEEHHSAVQSTNAWESQTLTDAEQALNELSKLQQYHQQLVIKWNELQDCYRRDGVGTPPYHVKIIQRRDTIDLAKLHALVEICAERGAHASTSPEVGSTSSMTHAEHLTKCLEALQVQDKCLSQVLQLESRGVGGDHATVVSGNSVGSQLFQASPYHRPNKFYVVIYINGKPAFSTNARNWTSDQSNPSRQHPRGVVLFEETFRVALPYFPESVAAKVFEQGYTFDTAISVTPLPVILPGEDIMTMTSMGTQSSLSDTRIPLASLAPSTEWYQFSSTAAIPGAKWHTSFLNSSLYVNFVRRPHGRIHLRTSWIPRSISRVPRRDIPSSGSESDPPTLQVELPRFLPPKRPPITRGLLQNDKAKVIGCRYVDRTARHTREELNKSSFSYERDFLVHMRALDSVLDSNDPGNAAAMRLQRQSVSGKTLTKRNLLLQQRDREHAAKYGTSVCDATACRGDVIPNRGGVDASRWQHADFEDPMPLEESEITANDRYLSLLRPEVKRFDHRLRAENAAEGDLYSVARQRKMALLKIHDLIDRERWISLGWAESLRHDADCDPTLQSVLFRKAINVPVRMKQHTQQREAARESNIRSRGLGEKRKSGKDLPLEADQDGHDEPETGGGSGSRKNTVQSLRTTATITHESRIFVEICFQGKKRRTSSSLVSSRNGSNPVWMETLVVPFRPPLDDWSPESIQRCQDEIRINLFDQVVVPGEDDEARVDAAGDLNGTGAQLRSFHQENYYLGGVCIPFTMLYFNSGSLEATLRCNMPIEHVGYANLKSADGDDDGSIGIGTPRSSADDETPRLKQKSPTRSNAMGDTDQDGAKKNSREATFINLMMTLDPLLPQPVKTFDDTVATIGSSTEASDANKRLVQYATERSTKVQNTNAATKQRNFHVFLVRFVNLIPFLNDWHLFDGEKDIWSTSQEFLGINAGDCEEHAVLLCNYFHWLDRDEPNFRNYLVIGHAVPEGEGVYVLRQDAYKIPQRSVLWNASTGIGYHVWDEKYPMRDVSLVVSGENIYANVQYTSCFRDLNWDVETNSKAWKPFFHTGTIQMSNFALPCVQSRDLAYEETPTEYIHSVETEIRETLKLEIRRWRSSRFITTFNIDASMKLGDIWKSWRHTCRGLRTYFKGSSARKKSAACR